MKRIKELQIVDHPSFFGYGKPEIYIKINKNFTTYKEVYSDEFQDELYGTEKTIETDINLFNKLNEARSDLRKRNSCIICDGGSYDFTIIYEDDSTYHRFLQLDLKRYNMNDLNDVLLSMLKDFERVSFLTYEDDEDEDNLVSDEV